MCADKEDDSIPDSILINSPLGEESLAIDKLYTKGLNPLKIYYDFYVEKLVGYIPATFLSLKDPLYTHQHLKIHPTQTAQTDLNQVLSSVFDTFKEVGVKYIETDLQKKDRAIFSYAERYGFEFIEDEHSIGRLMTENVKIPTRYKSWNGISNNLEERRIQVEESFLLNPNRTDLKERIVEFILDKENISRRSLNAFFDYMAQDPNRIASHTILEKDDQIVGHSLTVRTRWDPNTGIMSFVNTKNQEGKDLRELIIGKTVLECKLSGIDLIEIYIREDVFELSRRFTPHGFKFRKILSFESIT